MGYCFQILIYRYESIVLEWTPHMNYYVPAIVKKIIESNINAGSLLKAIYLNIL